MFCGKHLPQDARAGQGRKAGCGGRLEEARSQRRRREIPAHDVDLTNAALKRALGGLQLENHAARNDAGFDQLVHLRARNFR